MGRHRASHAGRPLVVPHGLHARVHRVERPGGRARLPGMQRVAACPVLGGHDRRDVRRHRLLHGDHRPGRARHGGVDRGHDAGGDRGPPARERAGVLRGRGGRRAGGGSRHGRAVLVGGRLRAARLSHVPQLPGARGSDVLGARAGPGDVQRPPVGGESAGEGNRGQGQHHPGAGRAHPGLCGRPRARPVDERARGPGGEDGGAAARRRQPGGARPHPVETRTPHLRGVRVPQEAPGRRRQHHQPGPVPLPGRAAGALAPRALGRPRVSEGAPGREHPARRARALGRGLLHLDADRAPLQALAHLRRSHRDPAGKRRVDARPGSRREVHRDPAGHRGPAAPVAGVRQARAGAAGSRRCRDRPGRHRRRPARGPESSARWASRSARRSRCRMRCR